MSGMVAHIVGSDQMLVPKGSGTPYDLPGWACNELLDLQEDARQQSEQDERQVFLERLRDAGVKVPERFVPQVDVWHDSISGPSYFCPEVEGYDQ